jgi:hypothetical protein
MFKAQNARMESLSSKVFNGLLGRLRQSLYAGGEASCIGWVAQKRVAEMAKMDPNLVGAAGLQAAFNEGGIARLGKAL